ncbi:MAG TPA: hypothetical protein VGC61_08695 [Pyrinomonadaceae bacterium]
MSECDLGYAIFVCQLVSLALVRLRYYSFRLYLTAGFAAVAGGVHHPPSTSNNKEKL